MVAVRIDSRLSGKPGGLIDSAAMQPDGAHLLAKTRLI